MNVMVIDDDPVSRMALADLVVQLEIGSTGPFESGLAAWKHLESNPPPLLICCDVRMPGMSGIEFLRFVKERKELARIPFVLVTSASEREIVQEAIQLGACGYIVKPFVAFEARTRLQGILRSAWGEIAEDPSSTLRRLGIPPQKLNAYYSAFKRQLDDALGLLAEQPGPLSEYILMGRLDAMQTGCLTLGLWHGARILDWLKTLTRPQSALKDYLTAVGESLEMQRQAVRDGSWRHQESKLH